MEKAKKIIERLKERFGEPKLELNFETPFQLLMAAILSAQTKDSRVNQVTEPIFKEVKEPKDLIKYGKDRFMEAIKSINFSKRKGNLIWKMAEELISKYDGKVPEDIELLSSLPGVGRKTSNMVVVGAFKKPGVIVDTHVKRVSKRIGLSLQDDPEAIEKDIKSKVDEALWSDLSLLLILLGRYICKARKPDCKNCPIEDICEKRI